MRIQLPILFLSICILPVSNAFGSCLQDIKTVREEFADELRAKTIDQQLFDQLNAGADHIQTVCNSGDEDKARAMLINLMINEQLGADDVYARSVNAGKGGAAH